ncbi:MAG: FtsQ-type POTRA domain-containing protein [Peptococcaceae bacterium]|nr:FtsQ-type POTRA domain-containing protein [Peptococcaceae bacterium]
MKLFRDKNRGPKIKEEDVIIPEAYLAYEREQEEKKRQEKRAAEAKAKASITESEEMKKIDAEIDDFKARLDLMLNNRQADDEESLVTEKPDVDVAEQTDMLENRSARAPKNKKTPSQQTKPDKKAKVKKTKKQKKQASVYPPQFIALLVGIVVAVAAIVVLLGPLMKIDKVDINELKYLSDDKVLEMTSNPIGQNLFRFNISKAENELLAYPYVDDVRISRHFPHRLEISITERQPAGVLLNNSNYLQFSKDGILLDNTKSLSNLSLPLITGFKMEDVPAPGEAFKDNERFEDILRIINACDDDLLRMLQEINIKDRNNILAYTSQGLEIRIGSVDNIETRMATLNDIINQVILSDIIEDPIEAIDIRYEKSPVVVLEGYSNLDVSDIVNQSKDSTSIQEKNDRANSDTTENTNTEGTENNNESGMTDQTETTYNEQGDNTDKENTDNT